MAIQSFNFSGRCFFPSVENLADILRESTLKGEQASVYSSELQRTTEIWRKAYKDLPRSEYLLVNREVVQDMKSQKTQTAAQIYDSMIKACGDDEVLAHDLATCIEQAFPLTELMSPVSTANKLAMRALHSAEDQCKNIEVDPKKGLFKVTQEFICVIKPMEDVEDTSKYTYYKGRVTIEGKTQALIFKSLPFLEKDVQVKVVHTKTYPNLASVRKANYRWISGISPTNSADYSSYLH